LRKKKESMDYLTFALNREGNAITWAECDPDLRNLREHRKEFEKLISGYDFRERRTRKPVSNTIRISNENYFLLHILVRDFEKLLDRRISNDTAFLLLIGKEDIKTLEEFKGISDEKEKKLKKEIEKVRLAWGQGQM
jgi:hypothetical protein